MSFCYEPPTAKTQE
uniref:Uncharacterized protein n=1 Tax=Anguilla anguilla TaxID=7936 RepID=A0A0E9Y0P9_ANGAN